MVVERTPHPDSLAGKRVLLMGLGAFGGGVGCARALAQRGVQLTITDLRSEEQLKDSLQALHGITFEGVFGGHRRESFANADWVVVNPAVPEEASWLQIAREEGCKLTTEVNLALQVAADLPCVAITGTHGKSTTAAWISHLLRSLPGRTILGGNLGGSLLEQVSEAGRHDRLVVELSSFQLERLDAPPGWPAIALFTCLRPDHLDRHGSFDKYAAAKRRLLEFQDAHGLALFPTDEPSLDAFADVARGRVERLDPHELPVASWGVSRADLPFQELYRLSSLQLAARAAVELGLPCEQMAAAIRDFSGLPHRMQALPSPAALRWVDNGVATHPEATEAALEGFSGELIVLIGGYDKSLPLGDLPEKLAHCGQLHLFGAGGRRIQEALPENSSASIHVHPNCASAITHALSESVRIGADLLFSPSFASFDEFANFRERALLFQEFCAKQWAEVKNTAGDAEATTY